MITIDQTKLEEFEKITLAKGDHDAREQGMCAMEAAAWLAGEEHSDAPRCVDPVIVSAMIRLNDQLGNHDRQRIKPYVIKALGTRSTKANTKKRGFIAADYTLRKFAPNWLELAGMPQEAEQLRNLPRIVDTETVEDGRDLAREIHEKAWTKYQEAYSKLNKEVEAKAAVKKKRSTVSHVVAAAYAYADADVVRRKNYNAVYEAVKKRLDEALAPMLARRLPDVLEMLDAMIAVGAK